VHPLPMISAGDFTYTRAIEQHCFVQAPLVALGEFAKGAETRGLMMSTAMAPAAWETLDGEGLLPPIAYAIEDAWRHRELPAMREGLLLIRDECGFQPWSDLPGRARPDAPARMTPLYGRWQYLTLARLQASLWPRAIPMRSLQGGFEEQLELARKVADALKSAEDMRPDFEQLRSRELELVRVQTTLVPLLRQGRYEAPTNVDWEDGDPGFDGFDWTLDEAERFNYAAAAAECGLDAEAIKERCDDYCLRAEWVDPTRDWMYLTVQLDRSHQEAVTKDALLARDLFDAAEVMRYWYEGVTDQKLPPLDELRTAFGHETAKENLFGAQDIQRNRATLPAVLEHYGLYPWRVQLIVEGESDEEILRRIMKAHGTSFERLGIHCIVMHGSSIPKNTDRLLAEISHYANYYLLVFDNEGNARELADDLVRRGAIEGVSSEQMATSLRDAKDRASKRADGATPEERKKILKEELERVGETAGDAPEFYFWKRNMEEDNFELDEICRVVEHVAQQTIPGFALDREAIAARRARELERPTPLGLGEIILDEAKQRDPPFLVGKRRLGELLGDYALEQTELAGAPRPIFDLAEHLFQLAAADRRLQGRLR
jgi:hypothetical protein